MPLLRGLLAAADALPRRCSWRSAPTTSRPARSTTSEGFTVVGLRRALLPAQRRGRVMHACSRQGAAVLTIVLGHRDLLRRDRCRPRPRARAELLADAVASSVDEHARFGGVVPEVASRAHLQAMVPTVHRALATAGVRPGDVDAVAVTAGPGAGRRAAGRGRRGEGLRARRWDVPLYGVNHLAAHVAVDTLAARPAARAVRWRCWSPAGTPRCCSRPRPRRRRSRRSARTIDDAAGEAFDKVARLLGLPFPGGPPIDRVARDGDPAAIAFPRGLTGPRDAPFDFSFSGLKTAVARYVEALQRAGEPVPVADVAASFQEAVVDVLTAKAVRAGPRARARRRWCSAAGSRPTPGCGRWPRSAAARRGIALRVPRPRLCTDNGAMVAALGAHLLAAGAKPSPAGPAGGLVVAGDGGPRRLSRGEPARRVPLAAASVPTRVARRSRARAAAPRRRSA